METLKAVFCFDENLTAQVCVAAASLADACRDARCEIHCVCTPAAAVVEEALRALIGKKDPEASLVMHCVENPYAGAYEVRGISAGTYLRLTLPTLLPETDRILYLDADVLVRESLLPLWQTEFGENFLAAVRGPVNLSEKWEWNRKRPYWHRLEGMKGDYINAGVTLLNLAGIRKSGLEQRWKELARERFYYQDQDILNITCQGRIVYLPPKYNRLAYLSAEEYGQLAAEGIYTGAECVEAQENPVILHYAGDKPWKRYDTNLGPVWWDFVNEIPALAALFDEEKARKYRGPSLFERMMRRIRRL
ncbi:MAG: glycosyltransferase family 8 protein [Bacteroidales bacterium]|nr:glycosyltransferase family 8 protein [Bacteroidales bacterium]MCM1414498.1 glycosyltransferase family 8 protein [bacterium]MCM1423760.1 glycosyltransferase family 8 protein [bacterium]